MCTGVTVAELAAEAMMGTVRRAGPRRVTRVSSAVGPSAPPGDEALFESLRALRRELADAQRVPAYIVFSDKVLWEMAARRPATPVEMLAVPGVGPVKLKRYGPAFLELLGDYRSQGT